MDAPAITEAVPVLMKTDVGDLNIEIYPQAAPNSAKRFLELVEKGFYNDTPIFRVIRTPEPFMAQFGINWRHAGEQEKTFKEDPTQFSLERGTLAFAKTGAPDSASTQVFINYGNNDRLASMNFTVFGRVTKGMEVADKWKEGELGQMELWTDGEKYLKSLPAKPNMIVKMNVVKPKANKPK
jgi:cyclophilin family peptidyl-prolyl cis-trans isomerase